MHVWLELIVQHTLSKAEAKSVPVFFHACQSILGVLCGQYLYDPLVWLFVQWCINLTHTVTDELREVLESIWMIGVHGISYTNQGKGKKCASFILFMLVYPWSIVWSVWI